MDINTLDSRGDQQSLSSPGKYISPFTTPCDTSIRDISPSIQSEHNIQYLYLTPLPVARHPEGQIAKRKLTFCLPPVSSDQTQWFLPCDQTQWTSSSDNDSSPVKFGLSNKPQRGRPSARDIQELHRLGAVSKFKCTECPMGFQRKKSLATHLLTHCGKLKKIIFFESLSYLIFFLF